MEREEILAALVEVSDEAMIGIDPDGSILSWNAAAERLYGYSASEILGRRVRELVPADLAGELTAIGERLRHGERIERLETRRLHKDGRELDVAITLAPVRDPAGRLVAIAGAARGIAGRKQLEEKLREREEQYREIFASTTDGLVINSADGRIVEVNPAFCRMHGYTRDELLQMDPRQFIHPDFHPLFENYVDAVRTHGSFVCRAIDIRRDGTPFPVAVNGNLFDYQGRIHRLCMVRDITAEVEAERLLEQQVAERTRELSTLLTVSHDIASHLELAPLLRSVLDQLRAVTEYTGASIATLEDGVTTLLDSRGPQGREDPAIGLRVPLLPAGQAIWDRLQRQEAVLCPDVRGDGEIAGAYRAVLSEHLDTSPFRYVRSWLAAPLVARGKVIGLLSLSRDTPDAYSERHASLLLAVAGQIAVALENARLFEEAQEETRKTAALAEIGASVALADSLQAILDRLAQSVIKPTGAAAAAVLLIDGDPPRERMAGTFGLDADWPAAYDLATRRGARSLSFRSLREGRPIVQRDARQVVLSLPEWEPIHALMRDVSWDTCVSLPLVARERPLGVLAIFYLPGDKPDAADLTFLSAVADQAAIAVENARLFAELQGKAALEERQRLARELHDSVSQALYGIALGARTARSLAERDPARVVEPLDYVLSLAEAGLAEMRALIFELRPESLATEGLVAALGRQATLLRARHGIDVELDLCGEPPAALETKEALYRIAQEAVQNVVKHAQSSQVSLRLTADDDYLRLTVHDDGIGFDAGGDFPGHLGLRSMKERALRLGGSLVIQSGSDGGTLLQAVVPCYPSMAPAETV